MSQFIEDIVKQVQNKLYRTTLYVLPYLVRIDSLVRHINGWLEEDESDKVGIATICGIGGIWKTTIAKVIYNQNIQKFEGCSFLAKVREASEECNGLVHLQRQLISDIVKGKAPKIYNADDGINRIKKVVFSRRVLLVLDDVNDLEKGNKIIGIQIPFHPRSKIIITRYARRIVKYCGEIPLALQVLGSSLSGKSMRVWKSALKKLEAIPYSKIQKTLKDKDYTIIILDACDFYTTIGIENLIEKSLLIVNEENKLMMYQLVRDMGLEIICQESPDPAKRSRLWHRDAFDVIREKIGSKTLRCLSIDLQDLLEHKTRRTMARLYFAKHSKNRFVTSN
ncbi:hypothetical protein DITRI_Ditri15bG0065900 [Diplodiscus trichospermus]